MAWLEDTQGHERFTLCIQNLITKEIQVLQQSNIMMLRLARMIILLTSVEIVLNVFVVFSYTTSILNNRPDQYEDDEHFYFTVHRARIGNVVICEAHSKTTSDVRLLEIKNTSWVSTHSAKRTWRQILGRSRSYFLYIRSNVKRDPLFKLVIETTIRFSIFRTPDIGITIQSIDLFERHLVCLDS